MAHVLVFALGPVQEFISTSRRCRDLWFSSWLVSELSKAAARSIASETGLEGLVFPGVDNADMLAPASAKTVANKIVARLPGGLDPAAVAGRAEKAVRQRLEELREAAFSHVKGTLGANLVHWPEAKDQVDDLPEIAWAFAGEPEGDYRLARREAERLLAARKASLLWVPVSWGGPVPKSSLDGLRESVLDERLFDGVLTGAWNAEQVRQGYGVGPTERLCGVGLLKRHGTREEARYSHQFLSTGHLAAWPALERLAALAGDPALPAAWKTYRDELQSLGADLTDARIPRRTELEHPVLGLYDGSLLFESGLLELFEGVPEPDRRRRLERARRGLATFLRAAGLGDVLPYYAVLVADGDRMGAALERQPTAAAHREISLFLDRFAQLAGKVVEDEHRGELIYAGGDDVLAFVPLHRALDCARRLSDLFHDVMASSPAGKGGPPPTLSVGIGISHFLEPLGQALNLARKAERRAKEQRGSLAVIVGKRSGAPVEVCGPWDGGIDDNLADFNTLHVKDWVPDGAAFELRQLAGLLDGLPSDDPERERLTKLVRGEAERVLRRKQPSHGTEQALAEDVLGRLLRSLDTGTSVAALADRLIVARLFAEARLQATPPSPPTGDPQ